MQLFGYASAGVLGKMADRAFSRQGKNEKFSQQFYHNWSEILLQLVIKVSLVHKSVVRL